MRLYAFGKKSLEELTALFAQFNLSLGLYMPNWTPDFVSPIAVEGARDTTVGEPAKDLLTPTQKSFLAQDLSRFHLSKRVAKMVHVGDIAGVGDLAILSADQAKALVGPDQSALRELSGLLASEQLHFGVKIPGWNADLAAEWERTYAAETQSIQVRHAIRMSGSLDSDLPHLEDELKNLVRLILKGASDRNFSIVVCFFGFDGTGRKTLDEVGQAFGVTRERIRQITSNFTRRVHNRSLYLPMFRSACNHIIDTLPNSTLAIRQSLRTQEIARTEFGLSGIGAILRLLNEDDLFEIVSIGESTLAVQNNTAELFRGVPRIARAIVSAFGCGHIEHILWGLEVGPERAIETQDVATVLNQIADVRWLDQAREWFTIVDTRRNRLSNVVQKVLSVAQKIFLSELRGAIKRVHRLDGFAPPSNVLKAFCSWLPFCDVDDEYVIANTPLSTADTLGGIEHCLYDVLREHGSVINLNTFRDECLQRGMNANSFYQYITYSPIICRLAREVYSLVGAEVPPGIVEELSQPAGRGSILVGHGWTDDGRIWISYRLNASNVRSGAFSLPTSFKEMVSGQYFIQSSGTGSQSIILAEGDRLTGLHRPIAIRGGEPDDVIVVTFDLRHLSAELRFGGEIESTSDANSAARSPNSFVTTTVYEDSPRSAITGNDLTGNYLTGNGNDKEWQPISTAPVDRDLEVRLEDPIGRYVLLFPCRLTPGQGWINSWLETPLGADPVDWRNWDAASIHF